MHCSSTVHVFKNIKNRSHDTIHTFKNYFATVFLVFSFSNNKFNPIGPIVNSCDVTVHVLGKKKKGLKMQTWAHTKTIMQNFHNMIFCRKKL